MEKWEIGEGCQQASGHDDVLASDSIRKPSEKDKERRADQQRNSDQCVRRCKVFEAKCILEEEQGMKLPGIPDHTLTGSRAEQREPDILCVWVGQETIPQRRSRSFPLRLHFHKDRRFLEFQPDVNRDPEQDHRKEERDSPAPGLESFSRQRKPASHDDSERKKQTQGGCGLNPACIQAAFTLRRVLSDIGGGASILAAQAPSLA